MFKTKFEREARLLNLLPSLPLQFHFFQSIGKDLTALSTLVDCKRSHSLRQPASLHQTHMNQVPRHALFMGLIHGRAS